MTEETTFAQSIRSTLSLDHDCADSAVLEAIQKMLQQHNEQATLMEKFQRQLDTADLINAELSEQIEGSTRRERRPKTPKEFINKLKAAQEERDNKEETLSLLRAQVKQTQEDIQHKDIELKALVEKKETLEDSTASQEDSEEAQLVKNQLLLLLTEKNRVVTKAIDHIHSLLTTGPRVSSPGVVIPPPPPMTGLTFNYSYSQKINLRGKLLSTVGREGLASQIAKLVKSVRLNTIRELDFTEVHLDGRQIKDLSDSLSTTKTVASLVLRKMNLHENGVHTIVASLHPNASVTHLDLSHNHISANSFGAIGKMLMTNTTLEALNISENCLDDLSINPFSQGLKKSNITRLHCHHCEISSVGLSLIAEGAEANEKLVEVDLSHNLISDSPLASLVSWIENSTTLETLNLSWNYISSVGMKEIAPALESSLSLQTLLISQNALRDEGATALGHALMKNEMLTALDVSRTELSGVGIESLLSGLKSNHSLTSLSLWGNRLNEDCAHALTCLMQSPDHKLATLSVRAMDITHQLNEFSEGFAASAHLKVLDLTGNRIGGGEHVFDLASALKKNQSLETLILSGNALGDAGLQSVADLMVSNRTITSLNLRLNLISSQGCKYLSTALQKNQTLKELDLSMNLISILGFKEIGLALAKNVTLTKLHLAGNECGSEGIAEFAKALEHNQTITHLDLSSNRMRHEGCVGVCALLSSPETRIKKLFMNKNGLTDDDLAILTTSLKNNALLRKLVMNNNLFDLAGTMSISELVQMNSNLKLISVIQNRLAEKAHIVLEEAVARNPKVLILH